MEGMVVFSICDLPGWCMIVILILKVGDVGISHKSVLVVGCFKKHRIAYLSFLVPALTLESLPHACHFYTKSR
jgi:hypothetical protein